MRNEPDRRNRLRTTMDPFAIPVPLAWILFGAGVFRAVYLVTAGGDPLFGKPILDAAVYDAWARQIAAGSWLSSEPFYLPPLYPYLVGLLYRLIGPGSGPVAVLQALIGLLNILLVFRIGDRVFGRRAAILAAGGAALYAPFPFFESKILGTTLGIALNLAGILLWLRAEDRATPRPPASGPPPPRPATPRSTTPRPADGPLPWALCGLAIGAAALVTPAAVLLGGLALLRQIVVRRPRAAVAILAGLVTPLLPVLVHNLAVAGDPMLLSAQGGITFYQGNNPQARGLYAPVPGFSGDPSTQAAEERAIADREIGLGAERETGRPLRRSEISRHFLRKGLSWMAAHPIDWIALEVRKAGFLIGNYEPATEYSLYEERGRLPLLRVPCLPFAAIVGLGLAGAWRLRGHPALRLALVYGAAVPLIFYVSTRYRVLMVPVLLVFAGALADRLLTAARPGWTGRALAGQTSTGPGWTSRDRAALVAATGLAFVSFALLGGRIPSTEANVIYTFANALADQDRHDEAIAAYDRALALFPEHPLALVNRGNSLLKTGRHDEALASYLRAEEIRPGFWPAVRGQALVLRRQGRFEAEAAACRRGLAEGGAEAERCLAAALERVGRAGAARETLPGP